VKRRPKKTQSWERYCRNGDYVLLHGRFSGMRLPSGWIVVDTVRLKNGRLAEHLDVIEDEATKEASVSGLPMFGDKFPT
jgi:predicted SnoaL-like aldol condensation-catalyzing enzyme